MTEWQAAEAHPLGEVLHDVAREWIVRALEMLVVRGGLDRLMEPLCERAHALVAGTQHLDRRRLRVRPERRAHRSDRAELDERAAVVQPKPPLRRLDREVPG